MIIKACIQLKYQVVRSVIFVITSCKIILPHSIFVFANLFEKLYLFRSHQNDREKVMLHKLNIAHPSITKVTPINIH